MCEQLFLCALVHKTFARAQKRTSNGERCMQVNKSYSIFLVAWTFRCLICQLWLILALSCIALQILAIYIYMWFRFL